MFALASDECPSQRLHARGVAALTTREVLAVVLGVGTPASPALDVADALLHEFGGLAALSRARPEELMRVPGVGHEQAASIVAAFHMFRLAASRRDDSVTICSPRVVAEVAWPRLAGQSREHVLVLVCDGSHRLRRVETVAMGTIDQAPFPIREILNCVLRHDGRAFAVAHNHPSGDSTPSTEDVECSIELAAAAETVRLRFLGQIVVADCEWQTVETAVLDRHVRYDLARPADRASDLRGTAAQRSCPVLRWNPTEVRRPSRRHR